MRVQIVDDHHLFAEALGGVIRDDPDYELVGIAATGPQAISIAQDTQPDIILLDVNLPGYSSETLIAAVTSASPNSRVVVLTMSPADAMLAQSMHAGIVGHLTKGRALDDVLIALGAVADGQTILTPEQLEKARAPSASVTPGESLTTRELEVLTLVSQRRDTQAIADQLVITTGTVRAHLQSIFAKLGAHSKPEAVSVATRRGLLR